MSYIDQFSGIVLNQNQKPAPGDFLDVTDGNWRYQEFFLPTNFGRGSNNDKLYPALTGLQALVTVGDVETLELDWIFEVRLFGSGWQTLQSGTVTESHSDGLCWVDIPFSSPINVDSLFEERFRYGIRAVGVDNIWYSQPNPFATKFSKAYEDDKVTPITVSSSEVSLCFRLLGLSADEGVDFLGNSYRSVVISSEVSNTDVINGSQDKIWLSKPNPSRFAVENLYFDVRPRQESLDPIQTNYCMNPSFEDGTSVDWTLVDGGTATVSLEVVSVARTDSSGDKSLHVLRESGTDHAGAYFEMTEDLLVGQSITLSAWIKAFNGADISLGFDWDLGGPDEDHTITAATDDGWHRYTKSIIIPPTSTLGNAYIWLEGAAAGEEIWIDDVQLEIGDLDTEYFDGNMNDNYWEGDPHHSYSVKLDKIDIYDDVAVIDHVLLDPITPNIYFNVYFSNEGDPEEDEAAWENKLWQRVPTIFKATKRESHALPDPILAKYIKIEMTHLQARPYSSGDLAKPIAYKKHPKWVLDYFLHRLDAQKALEDGLLTGRVGVVFDAIDLAYNYYLDDLKQEPSIPIEVNNNYTSIVNKFLKDRADLSDRIDPIMIDKIRFALEPYRDHPSQFATDDYLLGKHVRAERSESSRIAYPVEGARDTSIPVRYDDVKALRNSSVIFENDFPVMFFYLTCRHKYREVIAPLSHDRAYFAGIREIMFSRESYTVAHDNTQYTEPSGDLLNIERNDFTTVDGVMVLE